MGGPAGEDKGSGSGSGGDADNWVRVVLGVNPALFDTVSGGGADVSGKGKPEPHGIAGKVVDAVKDKLKQVFKPDDEHDGRGSPYHNEPPPAAPPDPNAPTILHGPEQTWDWPKGKQAPKKAVNEGPQAADGAAVAAAIAGIDSSALVPVSLRGKPGATDYPQVKEVGRRLANAMDAARKAKQTRADFSLDRAYPTPEDTKAVGDAMEQMARAIAAALPDGGSPLAKVGITLLPPEGHKGQGWSRIVSLGGEP